MESPLELNQEVLITIKKIGINGEGIGYYKRQAVFVEGTIPPEEVVIRISDIKDRHAIGELIRVKKKSFYRTRPFCKHYDVCGGCQLQHVKYEEQQRLKEDLLRQSFERYTKLDMGSVDFLPFNPIARPQRYRQKAQMPVRNTEDGLKTGLYRRNSHKLVDVLDCPVQDQRINRVNQEVLKICDKHKLYAFDPAKMRGLLRYLVTRRSEATGEMQVTLVITIFNKALKSAAKEIMALENVVSVAISKNHDAKNPHIFGDTYEILEGKESIPEKMGDITYWLNPKAFFQLNPTEAQSMYEYVRTLFDFSKEKSMVDLYTGSGGMALYFADKFKHVSGIDSSSDSILSATRNRDYNKLSNVDFYEGDAHDVLQKLNKEGKKFDVAVFDPSRTGLSSSMIRHLLKHPMKKLIYVSCNPSTLAKDINQLSQKYRLVSSKPFDMFPNTSHVESVNLLELKR
ncbi:MAG: 23S rRNA (uracil(1939)-C(5))-methyltransferase RlmD [Bacillota bacterium]